MKNKPDKLCAEICGLCSETGAYILESHAGIDPSNVASKAINSFVTQVDKQSELMLVNALGKLVPGSGFITEEGSAQDHGEAFRWIVDPLDGTTNFIHGVPCFCISIALQKNGKTVLGVVYEINRDERFFAWEGHIAMMNGEPINVRPVVQLKDALIATGFPYSDFAEESSYLNLFSHFCHNTRGIRRLGSAAADLAYVACGRFDAFYEYGLNAWDVAAGAFIVKRAGGVVSDFCGGDDYLFGGHILAAGSALHPAALKAIRDHYL